MKLTDVVGGAKRAKGSIRAPWCPSPPLVMPEARAVRLTRDRPLLIISFQQQPIGHTLHHGQTRERLLAITQNYEHEVRRENMKRKYGRE
jgi:hypothetical protein